MRKCPNCKETERPCRCMRNKCRKCGEPVGNITFTVCDDCWDSEHKDEPDLATKLATVEADALRLRRAIDNGILLTFRKDSLKRIEYALRKRFASKTATMHGMCETAILEYVADILTKEADEAREALTPEVKESEPLDRN